MAGAVESREHYDPLAVGEGNDDGVTTRRWRRRWPLVVLPVLASAVVLGTLVAVLGHRSTSTTGKTFSVETKWDASGSDLCAQVHRIIVEGQQWYQAPDLDPGLPPGRSYKGEIFIADEGPGPGSFVGAGHAGNARFTTGSTTVTFTRWRPCV